MLQYLSSSIGRKQLVGLSGLALALFLVAHLAGNLFVFVGPEALNAYAKKLHSLGALLWVLRGGLLATFLLHIVLVAQLVIENKKARGKRYAVDTHGGTRSLATRLMPLTGTILFVYIFTHLADYTFVDKSMVNTVYNGQDLGLYGLLVNSFKDSIMRTAWYLLAMASVGFHLAHGIQSASISMGYYSSHVTPVIQKVSIAVAVVIAGGFMSIPLYIYFVL